MMRPPPPGLYRDIDEKVYHGWDIASASRLRALDASTPLHLRHQIEFPGDNDSPAKKLGRAVHCLLLEPDRFEKRFAVAPDVDRRTTNGKAIYADFMAGLGTREAISIDLEAKARAIELAVLGRATSRSLLLKTEVREVSIVTELFGCPFKARLDAYGEGIVLDLKTTSGSASRAGFERSIKDLGYGIQAAAYCRAAHAVGLDVRHFVFIVVETDEPHAAAEYRMKDEVIELFDAKLPELCARYLECHRSRRWPGYPDEVQDVGIPAWYERQLVGEGVLA